MKIGELAERSGLTASRIRFYEASGLISVERKANGYRAYAPQALLILEIIDSAQKAGFSLEEIRHLLPPDLNTWQQDDLVDGLKRKIAEIEVLQERLAQSKAQLLVAVENIENRPEGMTCADNAKRVLESLR
jgi:DNA-binding transcriptional MerR regulator